MKIVVLNIEDIYVPAARKKELDPEKVEAIAEEVLEEAPERPIHVRKGNGRYVLVKGVNRLEARKSLGEETIQTHIVRAQQR